MKKILAGILCVGSVCLVGFSNANKPYSYYREANGNSHYELVTERTEKCVYIGNDTFVTPDGNEWIFSDETEREITKNYKIVISDNATTETVIDDIIMEVR